MLVMRCGDVELEDHRTLGEHQVPFLPSFPLFFLLLSLLSSLLFSIPALFPAIFLFRSRPCSLLDISVILRF
jgi:hypothetical protein